MKNPLNKRLPRELRHDLGKYLVIFLFLVMLISLVSSFLVADGSVLKTYEEGFEKYNIEWGHLTVDKELPTDILTKLEKENELSFYDLHFFEETEESLGATVRVYADRELVNTECLMSGAMPVADNEIAIDRVFAKNNKLEIGDSMVLNGRTLEICGLVALPDYSCLFEKNSDMMFDSVHFTPAIMTQEAFDAFISAHMSYNYAWIYKEEPSDEKEEKEWSDKLKDQLIEQVMEYDQELLVKGEDILSVKDFVPRYANKAITFTGEDMGGDKVMFLVFDYIVIAILAFVFAITISNTITAEAGVIGTLRASGYSRGELIRHYMILPMVVSLFAALVGNLIGYTLLRGYMEEMYFNSYSLAKFELLFSAEALIDTTLIPLVLMFVINLITLIVKMKISPLQFLRHEVSRKAKEKPVRLNTKIPIMHRFRARIIIQNIPNYITLVVGIVFAAIIFVFGSMMTPLFDDYAKVVSQSKIANYQYVLLKNTETVTRGAEKYCVKELASTDESYMEDEMMVYGIASDSSYIKADIPKGKALVSNGVMKKFGFKEGDTLILKDKYMDKEYRFTIAGDYAYDAALSVFISREDWLNMFEKEDDYFSGYFSNEEIKDIPSDSIATVITEEDLYKLATQLQVSMGNFMQLFSGFGIMMFLLMMYLLSKQIIEKNAKSISITKILGYTNGEISGLYIVSTSIVVVIGLLLAIPVTKGLLYLIFSKYLYKEMTGYIPFAINDVIYVKMFIAGVISFALVALLQMVRISRIPKSDALKNVE